MKTISGAIGLVVAVMLGASLALAHSGARGIVKERMVLMENIGEAMKSLSAIFKGERDYDAEAVKAAAAAIRDHAGAQMTKLFPEGSLDKPTQALRTIWEDWEEFELLAARLEDYSDALAKAADNPRGPADGMMGQGQGMMGQGQGMMGQGQGMMGQGQGMMGGWGPDPQVLATMPPDAAFMQTARTCTACHSKFRAKKN